MQPVFSIIGTVVHCPGVLPLSAPLIGSQITSIRFLGESIWLVGFAEAGHREEESWRGRGGGIESRAGGGERMAGADKLQARNTQTTAVYENDESGIMIPPQ